AVGCWATTRSPAARSRRPSVPTRGSTGTRRASVPSRPATTSGKSSRAAARSARATYPWSERSMPTLPASGRGSQGAAVAPGAAWGLHEVILVEALPGTRRVALWVPGGEERGYRHWQRVTPAEDAGLL